MLLLFVSFVNILILYHYSYDFYEYCYWYFVVKINIFILSILDFAGGLESFSFRNEGLKAMYWILGGS